MVRRPDGSFAEVGWDEAFARCTDLLLPVIAEHGIAAVTAYVGNPLLGGLHPTREDLTWAILLAFATGLVSIYAIVLSTFDLARTRSPG